MSSEKKHAQEKNLENYFAPFREKVIGYNQKINTPFGEMPIVYADWTASGRLYKEVEETISQKIGPFVANTHSESSTTGSVMTKAYHKAKKIIKMHVNANEHDILISSNAGMTGVINKFQRILGLKIHEKHRHLMNLTELDTPIVFVTHMEHHSNQTSWLETIADVEIIPADKEGFVDLNALKKLLEKYKFRKTKIAAVTSCSNITGVFTPYYKIAEIMHEHGGYCFVDFAASAPYIEINMHRDDKLQYLDAIFFSPHKFLGGPGTTGILIFKSSLYSNRIPDNPGGGTVEWTNPWGEHQYVDDIEAREDGGTPGFLQTMRVAQCILLKEKMGVHNILLREKELLKIIWKELPLIPNIHILAENFKERLGIFSFYVDDLHYNLAVKLLNDRFGVQVRGGCSCAGTYGHFLLGVDKFLSYEITHKINKGDLSLKPGWIRMSIHPVMSNEEVIYALEAIKQVCANHKEWAKDYKYNPKTNEFKYIKAEKDYEEDILKNWFN